jgi:uncharacterized protein (TIRG00374 family)
VAASDKKIEEELDEWSEPTDEAAEERLEIGNRLANWKTIASFAFAAVVLALVAVKGGIDPAATWHRLQTLNLGIFLAAFLLYYATFPIRGSRWKLLLHNAYEDTHPETVKGMSVRGLSEILYISWFVNCVVPAKLGDLYRAYLAKLWTSISWTKTVGTIMAERITDILVLSLLLAATGLMLFHNRLGHVSVILGLGVGLAVVGILALVLMKLLGRHIRERLPARFVDRYIAFEEGTLKSFRRLPLLLGLTALIWLMEGGRLQLVFTALGLSAPGIPFFPMLFFALATAVLTTIPLTPGGLGVVEVAILSLMTYVGISKNNAAAVVVVDRILSYYSIALFGFVVYLLSKRSHFRHPV